MIGWICFILLFFFAAHLQRRDRKMADDIREAYREKRDALEALTEEHERVKDYAGKSKDALEYIERRLKAEYDDLDEDADGRGAAYDRYSMARRARNHVEDPFYHADYHGWKDYL